MSESFRQPPDDKVVVVLNRIRDTTRMWIARLRQWVLFFGPRRIVHGAIVVVSATAVTWWLVRPSAPAIETTIPLASSVVSVTEQSVATTSMRVHVTGAVRRPGVYSLVVNARIVDAVRAAGGATRDADLEAINLAQTVLDTEQVHVPSRSSRTRTTVASRHRPQRRTRPQTSTSTVAVPTDGLTPRSSPATSPTEEGGRINLNAADASTLDRLPGIGPATAKAIIDYRTRTGPFSKLDDLLKIDGIGPKKLAGLADAVTL